MPKRAATFELTLPPRDPGMPATLWLSSSLRTEILEGRVRPGSRLAGGEEDDDAEDQRQQPAPSQRVL